MDRDGVINRFGNFVRKPEELFLMEGAAKAIKRINESSYLAICVTNQPIIARGEATLETLEDIHNKMEDLLGNEGAYLNDLFFCPHHPDKGFPGERPEYKIDCDCRKPKTGMFKKAQAKYNIDFTESWMIGDTCQDVQAGINAGCKTCLVTSGDPNPYKKYGDVKPDLVCKDLEEAISKILG
ncbi:MAG: HAD family hydrolase [Bacilli bacterium]|nr:HAD family hydrolase [Bacilli bacterium]